MKKMMQKNLIFIIIAFISLGGLVRSAAAERDFSQVDIDAVHVAGSVYVLFGSGGNIGVSIGNDGVLMVDDQFAPLSEKITSALDTLGGGKPKYILNTHWHGDHTGGNAQFGREATIIAHHNVRKRLLVDNYIDFFDKTIAAQEPAGLPVITFDDALSIHFNDEEIEVLHLARGHTDGDSVIYFKNSNVLHAGDHFFNGFYPFVDLKTGGNVEGFAENVAGIIARTNPETKIIPGHGPLATREDLKRFHQMLVNTTAIVEDAMTKGRSLEEIQDAGFPEAIEKKWGNGFIKTDQWISLIYESLRNTKEA